MANDETTLRGKSRSAFVRAAVVAEIARRQQEAKRPPEPPQREDKLARIAALIG